MSDYDWYKEETESLHEEYSGVEWAFDITIIVLSAIGTLSSTPALAKVAFATSLLLTLLGLRVNAIAINRQLDIVYRTYVDPDYDGGNIWVKVLGVMNWAIFLAFSIGVILLTKGV